MSLEEALEVSVSEAKAQLTELVRRAEAGEEIVLTRHGRGVVKLASLSGRPSAAERRSVMEEVRVSGRAKASPGPTAERSQDFLYDGNGLPA